MDEIDGPDDQRDPLRLSREPLDLSGLFDPPEVEASELASVASGTCIDDLSTLLSGATVLGVDRADTTPAQYARLIAGNAKAYLMRSFETERALEVANVLERMQTGYRVAERRAAQNLAELRKLNIAQTTSKVTLASSKEVFPVLKNKPIHLSGPLGDPQGKLTKSKAQVSVDLCANIVQFQKAVEQGHNAVLVFPDLPALMLSGLLDIHSQSGSTTYLLNQGSRAIAVYEVEANKTLRSNLGLTNTKGTTILKEGRAPSAAAALRAKGDEGTIECGSDVVLVKDAVADADRNLQLVREQARILDPLQDLQSVIAIYARESADQQAARADMMSIAQQHDVDLLEYRFHSTSRGTIKALAGLAQMVIGDGRDDMGAEVQRLLSCMSTLSTLDDVELINKVQRTLQPLMTSAPPEQGETGEHEPGTVV